MWYLALDILGRTLHRQSRWVHSFWGYNWRYGCIGSFGIDFGCYFVRDFGGKRMGFFSVRI
jgi:hypothetical protein